MTSWPNKEVEGALKTMRFGFQRFGDWPRINDDTLEVWRHPEPIWSTLVPPTKKKGPVKISGGSFLKAFYGAPCWTLDELAKFGSALGTIGITMKKVPKEKDLRSFDNAANSQGQP